MCFYCWSKFNIGELMKTSFDLSIYEKDYVIAAINRHTDVFRIVNLNVRNNFLYFDFENIDNVKTDNELIDLLIKESIFEKLRMKITSETKEIRNTIINAAFKKN